MRADPDRSMFAKLLPALLLIAGLAQAAAEPLPARATIVITDVGVIDVGSGRTSGPKTVLVAGGRIDAIDEPGTVKIPPGAERIDGRGKFLIPGLVDMHVHLFNNFSRRPPNDWAFPLFVANGVTAVREMSANAASIDTLREWRRQSQAGERIMPRVLAAGIPVRGTSPADAAAQVDAAKTAGADFIKVFSDIPEVNWRAALDQAARRSLTVSGHVPAGVALLTAAAAGQRTDEHLMQAYEACSSIEATLLDERKSLEGNALIDKRDEQESRALEAFDGKLCARVGAKLAATHQAQVPTLALAHAEALHGSQAPDTDPRWQFLRPDERVRWQRNLASVSPAAAELAKLRWTVSRDIAAAFHRAGVTMLAGTDTPMPNNYPGYSLHDELALLVESGLTPSEALHAATLAPAAFLGQSDSAGTVRVGRRADLVLLDADPTLDIANTRRIDAVVLDGRLLRRADLDALLKKASDAQKP